MCTHPTCKSKKGHTLENCWTRARELARQADDIEARRKGKEKANAAKASGEGEEAAALAGNASTSILDPSHPCSPLILDASTDWNADTGATSHMTPHRHWFSTYTPWRTPVRLADNKVVYSVGKGSVRFAPCINNQPSRLLEFHNVLHVPALRSNLLSVLYLTRQKEYKVIIQRDTMQFYRHRQLLFTATVNSNNAAFLDGQIVPLSDFAGKVSTCNADETLWHRRFCHLNKRDVQKVIQGDLVRGVEVESKESMHPICEPCLAGK